VSHENVEIVSAVIAAFSRAGVDAALSYFTPNVEWFAPPEWPEDRRYEGYDGLKKLASVWTENFDNFELELNRTIDAGDHVVVLLYQRGRIRRGSGEVEHRTAWDWRTARWHDRTRECLLLLGGGPQSRGAGAVGNVAGASSRRGRHPRRI
jgi:ketosteroid isomerase-like protein